MPDVASEGTSLNKLIATEGACQILIMREGPSNFLSPTKEKCARCR